MPMCSQRRVLEVGVVAMSQTIVDSADGRVTKSGRGMRQVEPSDASEKA
jgi:hypothetical protein